MLLYLCIRWFQKERAQEFLFIHLYSDASDRCIGHEQNDGVNVEESGWHIRLWNSTANAYSRSDGLIGGKTAGTEIRHLIKRGSAMSSRGGVCTFRFVLTGEIKPKPKCRTFVLHFWLDLRRSGWELTSYNLRLAEQEDQSRQTLSCPEGPCRAKLTPMNYLRQQPEVIPKLSSLGIPETSFIPEYCASRLPGWKKVRFD
ncbi:hypothetical protein GGS20DRAFT_551096 [Poronia punctata]|nr:hypothetical protein GGS20DRAFT_551096 [Poronia punctata]